MTMMQSSIDMLAKQIISNFIEAIVLIDDHWSEAENALGPLSLDTTQLNLDPQSIALQEGVDSTSTIRDEVISTSSTSTTDPAYLREIGKEITHQGFLFTGFQYTDARMDTAVKLASKSDILILDWFLGTGNPAPAIELLKSIKDSGSPRFVFILTDQTDFTQIKELISNEFGKLSGETSNTFNCGSFSFSLKNKPQAGGQNTVDPTNVISEAIKGIRKQYGGLLQLAALELLSSYKGTLHEVLSHFGIELDVAFISEWFEERSPIGPNNCFRSLMIDEWRSLVERTHSTNNSILSKKGISTHIASKSDTPTWGGKSAKRVHGLLTHMQGSFPTDGTRLDELEQEIRDWMEKDGSKWPELTKPGGVTWNQDAIKSIIVGYLSEAFNNDLEYMEHFISLDAFFHSQSILPFCLSQGTVLQRRAGGQFLICITPACDCSNPKNRIKFTYTFLQADRISPNSSINKVQEGAVVAIRTKDNDTYLLKVTIRPPLSFRITDAALNGDLKLYNPFSPKQCFHAEPIAQLRQTRAQSLVSLSAGKAIEIGLDRSELLRKLCKSN